MMFTNQALLLSVAILLSRVDALDILTRFSLRHWRSDDDTTNNKSSRKHESPMMTMYTDISQKAMDLPLWPDSDAFLYFDNYPSGIHEIPVFYDGNGPVTISSLLDEQHNPSALHVVQESFDIWDGFCSKVMENILENDNQRYQMKNNHLMLKSNVPHMTVAVFQEHPSHLRTQTEKDHWTPIDEMTMDVLVSRLSQRFSEPDKNIIATLSLEALLFTPDGALIAGFLDTTCQKDAATTHPTSPFQNLRETCIEEASSILPNGLTSRPKNLIHVTIGRFLGLPTDCSESQKIAVTELMREYNNNILPEAVNSMKERGIGSFELVNWTLLRNHVWLCEEYEIFKTWDFSTNSSA